MSDSASSEGGAAGLEIEPDEAERPLVLGVDLGTSSVRALAYDRFGRRVDGGRVRYDWETTATGGVEVDADALVEWIAKAVDAALGRLGGRAAGEIAGVGVSSFWHSLVGVGEDGSAVTPVSGWNEGRATAAALRLRRELDEAAVHKRTGAVFHPSYWPARLLWARKVRPDVSERVRYWMSAGEYLGLRLFGERRASLSMASATGIFDQRRCGWDEELLDALQITAEQLSPLVDLDEPSGGLEPEFAERWPALAEVPWLPAVGDGAAANVGSGCTGPDTVALSLGTSGALRVLSSEPDEEPPPRGLWRYRLDRERALTGGAISNAGNVYEWMRDRLRLPDEEQLESALAAVPPDSERLTVLPYFAGERSPDWPLAARAAVVGMSLDTEPVEILRAGLEAVAYRLARIHERLHDRFPGIDRIVASGGAVAHSPVFAGIIADVLDQRIVVSAVGEASCRGAALLALESEGAMSDRVEASAPEGEEMRPDPDRHARYREAIERYRELDELLVDWGENEAAEAARRREQATTEDG